MIGKIICRTPFSFTGVHSCSNLVVFCSDFRFRRATEKLERFLGIHGNADALQIPGGIKTLNEETEGGHVSGWIRTLHKLHGTKNIFIIAHGGKCGAYVETGVEFGDEEEQQRFHEAQLRKAKCLIEKIIAGARVRMIFARLGKNDRRVEFVEIN